MFNAVEFGAITLAHALAVMSPGPDFALVLRQSMVLGRGPAVRTAVGIGCGILVHTTYAMLGVGWLVRSTPALFLALKICGAAYLAWVGVQCWRSAARPPAQNAVATTTVPSTGRGAWRRGFLTNVLNPKATLFFVALFSVGIDPATPRWVQAGYGLWMAVLTAVWFSVVGLVLTRPRVRDRFLRWGPWIDRGMGVVFLAFAASLLIEF